MPTDKKTDTKKSTAPAVTVKEISESELKNVSGGLWDMTIIDTCENAFVLDKCVTSFWGKCPKFIIESKETDRATITYCFSCNKGCFTKLKYITYYEF